MLINDLYASLKSFFGRQPKYRQLEQKIEGLKNELESFRDEETNRVMASMLDMAPGSITVHDFNGKFLYANTKTFELHGYSKEEFLKLSLKDIDVPESARLINKRLKLVQEQGQASFEVAHFCKDRSVLSFQLYVKKVSWKGIPAILSIATDITVRKQNEKTIRNLSSAIEQIIEGIAIGDLEGKIVFCNKAWGEMHGYRPDEMPGQNLSIFHTPEQMEKDVLPFIQHVLNEGFYRAEVGHVKKDGNIFPTHMGVSLMKDDSGNPFGMVAVAMDISERKINEEKQKQNEETLKEMEYFLQKSQSIAQIGSYSYHLNTGKWFSSNALDEIFGIDNNYNKDVDGWGLIIHPDFQDEMVHYLTHHVIAEHNRFDKEYKIIRINDRKERWVHGLGELEFDDSGNVTRMIGTIQDITDRKKAIDEIKKAKNMAEESDRLKTAFLQNMTHEIRTPMNAIIGFSSLLQNMSLSNEKRNHFASIIVHSGNQLLSIVNDILTISSIDAHQESVNYTNVCINQIIQDLLSIVKFRGTKQNVTISTHLPLSDKESEVSTDLTKLNQILTNLLNNAFKFTNVGKIEIGYEVKGNFLEFFVKDNGIGIKQDAQEKIFERFRQADSNINKKFGGTGLGLAISKAFVEIMGGKIWVSSEINKGSTFYFKIPYRHTTIEDHDIKEVDSARSVSFEILIAEDEENNFAYLKEVLSELNAKIIHAENGKRAVELCENNPAIGLVLMDIRMPVMDGIEATKKIKKLKPHLPIIAQSAYIVDCIIEDYKKKGFNDCLKKPIDKEKLIDIVLSYTKK